MQDKGSTSRRQSGINDSHSDLKSLKVYSGPIRNNRDHRRMFTLKTCRVEKQQGISNK
jgi:hypothetical protein